MLRTKQQQHDLCSCAFSKTANLIGDSVMLLIIRQLSFGTKRFGEIAEALPGVSTRTLTQKLMSLVETQLIERKEFTGKPPKVEYSLTEKGSGLHAIAEEMVSYGETYL